VLGRELIDSGLPGFFSAGPLLVRYLGCRGGCETWCGGFCAPWARLRLVGGFGLASVRLKYSWSRSRGSFSTLRAGSPVCLFPNRRMIQSSRTMQPSTVEAQQQIRRDMDSTVGSAEANDKPAPVVVEEAQRSGSSGETSDEAINFLFERQTVHFFFPCVGVTACCLNVTPLWETRPPGH
jgi:hypothetical protein